MNINVFGDSRLRHKNDDILLNLISQSEYLVFDNFFQNK